jgi:hypothetical protein
VSSLLPKLLTPVSLSSREVVSGIQPASLVHGIVLTILVGRYLISVYLALWYRARRKIQQFVGDVDATAVACGFGRTFGNKVRFCNFLEVSNTYGVPRRSYCSQVHSSYCLQV